MPAAFRTAIYVAARRAGADNQYLLVANKLKTQFFYHDFVNFEQMLYQ
jgi:hypothetical protein